MHRGLPIAAWLPAKRSCMKLGELGVWNAMDSMSAADGAAFAKRVEAWGYSALWLPEGRGRNVMMTSSWLLANTTKLIESLVIGAA